MRRHTILIAGACIAALAACSSERKDSSLFDEGGAGEGGADDGGAGDDGGDGGGDDGGDDGGGDDGGDDGDDDGMKYDVGGGTDGPGDPDGETGCTMVDILFVIDNSTSMRSYQEALAAVAPSFADAIFASLPEETNLHVGVTTSSFFGGSGGTSPGEGNCSPYYEGAGMTGRDDLYDFYWTPDGHPYDENGGQGRLREHGGKSFFEIDTDADPTPMHEWLVGNIRAVGESGSVWEMVAAGAAYPFHPANAGANDGFLRDAGSVLVIFALTDEVGNSPEDVSVYHDMIVAAKSQCGGDDCIVTGGVMQPCMANAPDNRLYPLLASFGKEPIVADIGPELDDCFDDCDKGDITHCNLVNPPVTCEELYEGKGTAQYSEALGDALAQVIAQVCDEIPPPP
jgi:hypothetical protein